MSKKKDKSIKICFLGDEGVGKNEFIENYLSKIDEKNKKKEKPDKNKPEGIVITKQIAETKMKISIYQFSEEDEKYINLIQQTQCVFVLFDMSSRDSFDSLLDKWIIWLREQCRFAGLVMILGNYVKKEKDAFLSTNKEEVDEMIKVSEISGRFEEIGNKTNEEKIQLIDMLINEAEEYGKKANLDSKKGDDKNCIIF